MPPGNPAPAFLPKDFIASDDPLYFAVVAPGTECQRVRSALRYVGRAGVLRKLSTEEARRYLRSHVPDYEFFSRELDIALCGVPTAAIARHYLPRQRLRDILRSSAPDALEQKLVKIIARFRSEGIEVAQVGVTGSMLIGAHRDGSDIDLVFYDRAEFFKARDVVRRASAAGFFSELDQELWREAYRRRAGDLSFEEYLWHEKRKYNKTAFRGTKIDLSFVDERQAPPAAGFRKRGQCQLRARVVNDDFIFDYPARYLIDDPRIPEILCFTPTYCGHAFRDEVIEVSGILEAAPDGRGRIIVGTSREAPGQWLRVVKS